MICKFGKTARKKRMVSILFHIGKAINSKDQTELFAVLLGA